MDTRPDGVTIRDVARHAHVGVGTVSRVLNDSPLVSDETRRRVRHTIDELGYRRSATARNLSLGRTQTIGVVTPFVTSASVHERLRGVVDRLHREGEYDLLLFDATTLAQRADAFREFARRDRVDGALIISLQPSDAEVQQLQRERLPVVLVDARHRALPSVAIDDARGGELAAEHLLAKGHRRIGFIGDAPSPLGFSSSIDRSRGLRRRLARAGVPAGATVEALGPHGRVEAEALALELLQCSEAPSAIFAASDLQAMGVLQAARRLGLRVPEDLAVIGFDDLEVAEVLGLTTVRQPLRDTGLRGADILLEILRGRPPSPARIQAPLTVIERATT
jgi:LacI family transcriptional regulator/LacI family repressor for deo operon, udp, cdd, tsx, nupC, and nupG